MEWIYPIDQKKLKPYIGQRICAVLHDGSLFFGVLGGIDNGSLYLTAGGNAQTTANGGKKKAQQRKGRIRRDTNAVAGVPIASPVSGGGLPLDAVAVVYTVPEFGYPFLD